jgi:hypothetical protein
LNFATSFLCSGATPKHSSSCKKGFLIEKPFDDQARNLIFDVVFLGFGCSAVWWNLVVARFSGLVNLKNGNSLFDLQK